MASKCMTVAQIAARRTAVIATHHHARSIAKAEKNTFMHVGASRVNSASNTFLEQHTISLFARKRTISEVVKLTLTFAKKNMLSKQGTALIEESEILIHKD